jgi:membrane-associated protease RseP (regulator of RpoE activity)
VGSNPAGIAVTDAKGRFTLRELAEGTVAVEAYAPDVGRARAEGVKVVAGRVTVGVRIALGAEGGGSAGGGASSGGGAAGEGDDGGAASGREPAAGGSVAVTLGETGAPVEVVIVSVVEGSEAERAGVAPGDVLVAVDGDAVTTIADARAKLSGPIADDVVVRVRRGDRTLTLRVAREAIRR